MRYTQSLSLMFLFATSYGLGACGTQAIQLPEGGNSDSILASLGGLDDGVRKANTLTYRLICASTRDALKDAPVVEQSDAKSPAAVAFSAPLVKVKDWCAIEVVAKDAVDPKKYKFLSRQGLFYATTAAQVDDQRKLTAVIHPLYKDLSQPQFAPVVSVVFPPTTVLQDVALSVFQLTCNNVAFSPDSAGKADGGKLDLTYGLQASDFTSAVSCTLSAKIGDTTYNGDASVSVQTKTLAYGPVNMTPKADPKASVQVTTTSGPVCTWDPTTYDCAAP